MVAQLAERSLETRLIIEIGEAIEWTTAVSGV